jgi:hypothetical protein
MGEDGSSEPTADYFRQLERSRLRALVTPDIETARALHADDYELITPGAARLSGDGYLGAIAAGTVDYRVFEPASEIAVRIFDGGAAVRYQARIDGRFSGRRDFGLFWHTDIYERRGGRWQAVWSQATRIPRRSG